MNNVMRALCTPRIGSLNGVSSTTYAFIFIIARTTYRNIITLYLSVQ